MRVEDVGGVEHVFGFLVDFFACGEYGGVERLLLEGVAVELLQVSVVWSVGAEKLGVDLVAELGRQTEERRLFLFVRVSCAS